MPELSLEQKLKNMEKERAKIKKKYPVKKPKVAKKDTSEKQINNVSKELKSLKSKRKKAPKKIKSQKEQDMED